MEPALEILREVGQFLADVFTGSYELLIDLFGRLGISQVWAEGIVLFLGAFVLSNAVLLSLIINIWLERKVSARIQDRIGPNRVGPWGIVQTVADLGKLLTKEIIIPSKADLLPFMIAPIISVLSVIATWAVVPVAPSAIGTDLNIGALYIIAVGSLGIMAVLMAGWSSNNKYALMGAFRGVAMLVSYEVPMVIALMIPVMLAGSMQIGAIVEAQAIPYVVMVPIAALIFWIAVIAEVGRHPFDLLEAESEIVAGYSIEYSGFAFAMFYAAEWAHGFTVCALMATLFFGGWRGPLAEEIPTLGHVYFIAKTYLLYLFQIWIRFTVPRLRIDQIMSFGWKFLIPVSLLLLVAIAVVDRGAALVIPGYLATDNALVMVPRTLTLLTVNIVVGGLTLLWLGAQGRAVRQRAESAAAHGMITVESGTD